MVTQVERVAEAVKIAKAMRPDLMLEGRAATMPHALDMQFIMHGGIDATLILRPIEHACIISVSLVINP